MIENHSTIVNYNFIFLFVHLFLVLLSSSSFFLYYFLDYLERSFNITDNEITLRLYLSRNTLAHLYSPTTHRAMTVYAIVKNKMS